MSSGRSRSGGTRRCALRRERKSERKAVSSRLVARRRSRTSTCRDLGAALDEALAVAVHDAQELRLRVERKIADLVEEERAPIRPDHEPFVLRHAVGVARDVAEELVLDQRGGEGRRVVGDERALRTARAQVDGLGRELLA